uniref:Uncharacterized protein n=1 Tax=Sinocyclocheilus grahami TaxID=75366 RepID=A0A672SQM8_SINGR
MPTFISFIGLEMPPLMGQSKALTASELLILKSVLHAAFHCARIFKCTCTTDSIICVGSSLIPRTIPSDINAVRTGKVSFRYFDIRQTFA